MSLKPEHIIGFLPPHIAAKYAQHIDVFPEITSTNDHLLNLAKSKSIAASVCVAESQSAGRGRNSREWQSPPGSNLYFSQLIRASTDASLDGITLVVGIVLCQLLREITTLPFLVKWPNDIYLEHKKLAGILTEITVDAKGDRYLIIGIGLNIGLPEAVLATLPNATDLRQHGVNLFDSERFTAKLITHIDQSVTHVMMHGWLSYYNLWQQYDLLFEQTVMVKTVTESYRAIAKGVTHSGLLQVLKNDNLFTVNAADVSVVVE